MTIVGLPLHPLVVHLAVVFVPLAAVAALLTGWRAVWRERFSLPIAVAAVIGGVGAFLAAQSGEDLEHSMRNLARTAGTRLDLGQHPDLGSTAEIAALLFAAGAIAVWLITRYGPARSLPDWSANVAVAVTALLAIAAIVTMTMAGDTGARLVWEQVGTFAPH